MAQIHTFTQNSPNNQTTYEQTDGVPGVLITVALRIYHPLIQNEPLSAVKKFSLFQSDVSYATVIIPFILFSSPAYSELCLSVFPFPFTNKIHSL